MLRGTRNAGIHHKLDLIEKLEGQDIFLKDYLITRNPLLVPTRYYIIKDNCAKIINKKIMLES